MTPLYRTGGILIAAAALLSFAPVSPRAEDGAVQNQISVYTGSNAQGYLQPLANAFGAALNSSYGYSAYIPPTSFHISLEAPVMGVFFEDTDRTFTATTESGFLPETEEGGAPTVVGPGEAVTVSGQGGAQFTFPGGLDLNSFGLVVPQLRVSSLAGTEAILRWVAYEQGDADIGKISLFGIGGRHSISQYMGETPMLDLAVGLMYQTFKVGENDRGGDFTSTTAFSAQVQASKRAPLGFMTLEPYAALAFENLDVDLDYDDGNGNPVAVSLEGENDVRFTIGAGLNFVAGHLFADYSFAATNNFSFGLALGNVGRPQ
jgi:hypothetical protein